MNEHAVIRDKDGRILSNIYCRVFNELWSQGGRYYRGDVLSIKNRDTNDRLRITINGGAVAEVDYSNLHFRIIAAEYKAIPEHRMPQDIYTEVLKDKNNKVDRRIVKDTINIMFNCDSKKQAIGAINSSLNSMTDEEKNTRTIHKAKDVIELVENTYPDFKEFFCKEGGFGGSLQNLDARLITNVLDRMIEEGIVCLPVHDSCIVLQEHMNTLIGVMSDEFRQTFDWDGEVPLGIKYFDECGNLVDKQIVS